MNRFSINTFTNPNDARVSQAFLNGQPITREFPAGDPTPHFAAQEAFDNHYGHATLARWDAEEGERVFAEK